MTRLFGKFSNFIKYSYRLYSATSNHNIQTSKKPPLNVLFFGSDEFSLYSLKALFNEFNKGSGTIRRVEVVTCSQMNPVWKFSKEHKLAIQKWPPDLRACEFDIGLVVSFGHLIPEHIINKFPLGMLNVHASLLPRWRGASPIIYALAHGDKETGVTIMRIRPKRFDVGEIIYQERIAISQEMEMVVLHEKLGQLGADCLVETLRNIDERLANCRPQPEGQITYAPKITPEFAQIKWNASTATDIHNLQRALKSVLPLKTTWKGVPVKLLDIRVWEEQGQKSERPGFVKYNWKHRSLIVECADRTWISVKNVGVQGKKIMSAADFYNGFISKLDKNTIIACFR